MLLCCMPMLLVEYLFEILFEITVYDLQNNLDLFLCSFDTNNDFKFSKYICANTYLYSVMSDSTILNTKSLTLPNFNCRYLA